MRRTNALRSIAAVVTGITLCATSCLIATALAAPSDQPLLQSTDLQYLGAFKIPHGLNGGTAEGFAYGGLGAAYNSANNSLFMTGYDIESKVGEISIPQIINSSNLSALNTATVLQNLQDASHGLRNNIDANGGYQASVTVGGLLVVQNRLIGTAYNYYDASNLQVLSHWYNDSLSLSSTAHGMYQVGTGTAGFVSGYMATIPSEWQAALGAPFLTGNCCLSIISRTSFGPAASAFNVADLGVTTPAPAIQLVGYPQVHATLGDGTGTDKRFSLTTRITGLVFPEGTRSVLFFGSSGTGPYCYGPGTSDPSLGGTPSGNGVDPWCYDPTNTQKGTHAYPYLYQVWAYDANDLIAVKNGQKNPWEIFPYATWNYDLPWSNSLHHVGQAAWDPLTRHLYIVAQNSDDAYPVVHAFNVSGGTTNSTPPAAPRNLQVR